VEDQVASWVFLACHRPQMLPDRVRQRLKDTLAAVQGGLVVLGMAVIAALAGILYPPAVLPCAVLSFIAGLVFMGVLEPILTASPQTFLEGSAARLCRWAFLHGLRDMARGNERDGSLDTSSCYRLGLSAEGFTRTAERWETRPGPLTVTTRLTTEERACWDALDLVGRTDSHVFLVVCDGTVAIVPRRCFAGDQDFLSFAETARGRLAASRPTASTAITALSADSISRQGITSSSATPCR
jgi:hypothetical protein